ncbi:MAG TPA: hypothetical protein VK815_02245 [Candidatus Acidoferrales bacterium]|nr:hypothetical protein [Candidatus Acidoferrales bacterium]
MNSKLLFCLAPVVSWLIAGCSSGPRVYPPSDDLFGPHEYAVPREFKNGTATLTNVYDWSASLLGTNRPLKTGNEDIDRDGRTELLVSQPANAGTGGNEYFIFKATPKGYRFLGDLWFGGLRTVPPDKQGRPRLITFSSASSGSGRVTLYFLGRDGFHEIKGRMLPYGDGPHAEGRDWLVGLLSDRETGKEKEPTEATLDLIFGDPASINFSGSIKAGQRFERPFGGRFIFALDPMQYGWEISVHEKGREDDLAGLTLPLHGPNPRDIEGWDFRNEDNTGPSTMNSSVFSQEDREFVFSSEVGKSINGPESTNDISEDDIDRIAAFGEGELKITSLKLSPPHQSGTADIRRMDFNCKLTWRQKDLEPGGTNGISTP